MDRDLFIKYIQNRCTEKELEQVLNWFEGEAGMITGRAFLSKFWEMMRDEEEEMDEAANGLLNRIHHDLNIKQAELLLKISGNRPVKYKKRRILIQFLSRVAAILFLPVLIISIYLTGSRPFNRDYKDVHQQVTYTTIHSPVGSVSQVDLPDGTKVWLNHNTTLIYPNVFNKKVREVELTGEAYFKVHQNSDSPFVVYTKELNIVATGTEFNVMAYPGTNRIETTLASGRVELKRKSADGRIYKILEMKPYERAVYYDGTNEMEYGRVNVQKHILWKEGRLMFEKDPLDVVAERLGRFYNVEIIIKDTILSEYTYTATFEDETLPQVMELLKLATPIEYTITSRKKMDDGSYTKRKVFIKYKGK